MDRNSKKAFVAAKNKTFQDSSLVVIFHYRGMTVAQITKLRGAARKLGVSINVTKNTLTKLALKGTIFEGIADLFKGPTAIATSKDPVAAAKIVADLAKDNEKVAILGGGLNSTKLDEKGVKALAELPSLDALRSKLLGVLVAPATKIAGVAQAPAGQLARVFNAYATK